MGTLSLCWAWIGSSARSRRPATRSYMLAHPMPAVCIGINFPIGRFFQPMITSGALGRAHDRKGIRPVNHQRTLDRATAGLCALALVLGIVAVRARLPASTANHRRTASSTGSSIPSYTTIDPQVFFRIASTGERMGPTDAAVTIVVFSSYGCGYCREFEPVLARLRARFPDHVAVVMKHYMPEADRRLLAADLAAECALDQGKFAAYHHAYFRFGSISAARDAWRAVGDSAGIPDRGRFDACVRGRAYTSRIIRDTDEGAMIGVTATPTSFVNGIPVVGAAPYESLESLVAFELDRRVHTAPPNHIGGSFSLQRPILKPGKAAPR